MRRFIQSWIINTLAVFIAIMALRGHIRAENTTDVFIASLVLGILNAFIRPILLLLTLPLLIFTLGLFTIVINGCLLMLVHVIMGPHFEVDSFGWALLGALIISVISLLLNFLTGNNRTRIRVQRSKSNNDKGNGPVIDI